MCRRMRFVVPPSFLWQRTLCSKLYNMLLGFSSSKKPPNKQKQAEEVAQHTQRSGHPARPPCCQTCAPAAPGQQVGLSLAAKAICPITKAHAGACTVAICATTNARPCISRHDQSILTHLIKLPLSCSKFLSCVVCFCGRTQVLPAT